MPKKPREMEKLIFSDDGFSRIKKVLTEIIYIRQSLARLQFLFTTRTCPKKQKIP